MEIRAIADDEVPAFRRALSSTFASDLGADPDGDERFRALVAPGRGFAAFDRGAVVATAATFALALTVPGGVLPTAGLTMVTVRPTHRRRGILRALLSAHLEDARARGEPASALWASETAIYGRFGYGVAAESEDLAFSAKGASVAPGRALDEVELLEDEAASLSVPPVYDRVRPQRPGMFARSEPWWRWRRFADRPDLRAGATPRRYVVARRGERVTGYLAFRQRLQWEQGIAAGNFGIDEMVAVDGRAEATLWRYVSAVDLFPNVTWANAPVDALLPWITDDRRRVRRRRTDALWLRPGQIGPTLAARRYGADGLLRLQVEDEAHALQVDGGVGRCARTEQRPDLVLDRAALGAIYLGGVPPSRLAQAGLIEGTPAGLALADRMFASEVAPWCPELF
jgi:predicted acetyltransferase